MIVALDVHYDDDKRTATGAAVAFVDWEDAAAAAEYTLVVDAFEPYVPGEFYRRELPCLLAVLQRVAEPIDLALVDGYVTLAAEQPGLGWHLWEATGRVFPVVGVAKSSFAGSPAVEVYRGESDNPLFVTSVGIDRPTAAAALGRMHGEYRIPTLLKRADVLSRHRSGC